MNSRGNIIYVLVIIILILAIVVCFQGYFGPGKGTGKGGGENFQNSMIKNEMTIDWDGEKIENVKSLIQKNMNTSIKKLIIKTDPSNLRRPDKEEIIKLVKEKYDSYVEFKSIKE